MQAAQQAVALMDEWRDVSVGEALQMLSASFRTNGAVRAFGVKVLRKTASDEKLLEFIIQLVQCVRFDNDDGRGPLAGAPPSCSGCAALCSAVVCFFFTRVAVSGWQ